jgi:hypothetical protein
VLCKVAAKRSGELPADLSSWMWSRVGEIAEGDGDFILMVFPYLVLQRGAGGGDCDDCAALVGGMDVGGTSACSRRRTTVFTVTTAATMLKAVRYRNSPSSSGGPTTRYGCTGQTNATSCNQSVGTASHMSPAVVILHDVSGNCGCADAPSNLRAFAKMPVGSPGHARYGGKAGG